MESVLLNRIDDAQILQIDDILQRQPLTSNRRTGEAVFEKKKAANSITRRSENEGEFLEQNQIRDRHVTALMAPNRQSKIKPRQKEMTTIEELCLQLGIFPAGSFCLLAHPRLSLHCFWSQNSQRKLDARDTKIAQHPHSWTCGLNLGGRAAFQNAL